jgi:dihydrofolate reductase
MARLVFGMNMSLDGFVDHDGFAPGPRLFRHFIDEAAAQTGSLYGRRIYEIMRYWDEDHPDWEPEGAGFAAVWRKQPKWVVSQTLATLGPNANLISGDVETAVQALKSAQQGEIEVAGPTLAGYLGARGLIDEYRIYLHPVVLGQGTAYFSDQRPALRLIGHDLIDGDVIRLRYEPA